MKDRPLRHREILGRSEQQQQYKGYRKKERKKELVFKLKSHPSKMGVIYALFSVHLVYMGL